MSFRHLSSSRVDDLVMAARIARLRYDLREPFESWSGDVSKALCDLIDDLSGEALFLFAQERPPERV
jgi:hypothetical protein